MTTPSTSQLDRFRRYTHEHPGRTTFFAMVAVFALVGVVTFGVFLGVHAGDRAPYANQPLGAHATVSQDPDSPTPSPSPSTSAGAQPNEDQVIPQSAPPSTDSSVPDSNPAGNSDRPTTDPGLACDRLSPDSLVNVYNRWLGRGDLTADEVQKSPVSIPDPYLAYCEVNVVDNMGNHAGPTDLKVFRTCDATEATQQLNNFNAAFGGNSVNITNTGANTGDSSTFTAYVDNMTTPTQFAGINTQGCFTKVDMDVAENPDYTSQGTWSDLVEGVFGLFQ